jgi:hypothetical protein
LIATHSITGGANRKVLERITQTGGIFRAWADRPWVQDGATVRTSIVCFDDGTQSNKTLLKFSGNEYDLNTRVPIERKVNFINSDLTSAADVTGAKNLIENHGLCFKGIDSTGDFDIPGTIAIEWLKLPNPSGVKNSDVLKPYLTGKDITEAPKNLFIIDFFQMNVEAAAQYIVPFEYVLKEIKPTRDKKKDKPLREKWWLYQRSRPELRKAIFGKKKYIATVRHMKHRVFIWVDSSFLPDSAFVVFPSESDYLHGLLNSGVHIIWGLATGTAIGPTPRYTSTSCFETFPFPRPTPEQSAEIEKASVYLEQCRAHLKGKGKTLTEAYNALEDCRKNPSPTHEAYTLMDAHERLDKTVYAAYGWTYPLSEDEILEKLLALNLERAAAQGESTSSSTELEAETETALA